MLFVTAFAAILDLDSGVLDYCNAGHENPLVALAGEADVLRLAAGGGPPLCTVDGFDYRSAQLTLQRGATLCIVSDGVTEARNAEGELYGQPRLERAFRRAVQSALAPGAIVAAITDDAHRFAAGTEPADDMTVLALRWNGRDLPGTAA
jgi:serine phosphatase RsbU (regulator of sigma subunit)